MARIACLISWRLLRFCSWCNKNYGKNIDILGKGRLCRIYLLSRRTLLIFLCSCVPHRRLLLQHFIASDLYTDCICSLSAWMMEWLLIFFVEEKMDILDQTEINLVALRRTVYLTIQLRYFLHSLKIGWLGRGRKWLGCKLHMRKGRRAALWLYNAALLHDLASS